MMLRRVSFLAAALLVAAAPLAQEASPEAHALPFASEGNEIALAIGGASGAVMVTVREAPVWARFHAPEVEASGEAERVARFVFDVAPSAPTGEDATIVLDVRDAAGAVLVSKTIRVAVAAPEAIVLGAPRPNPARGAVRVPYAVPADADVRLSVIDALGREVLVLASGAMAAGGREARVDAGALAAGVYVVRLAVDGPAGREVATQRLTIAR